MTTLNSLADLLGRFFISAIFIFAGFGKITGYASTQAYMEATGVPGQILPLVILVELGGGLAILLGLLTRWAALALAGFSLVSALLFHANFADQVQSIMFMKNVAMAGGFLFLFVHGAGAWSLDRKFGLR